MNQEPLLAASVVADTATRQRIRDFAGSENAV